MYTLNYYQNQFFDVVHMFCYFLGGLMVAEMEGNYTELGSDFQR